jgi:hypothetical protein
MAVVMGLAVVMMMAVRVGGNHAGMLYYNITSAKAFKALEHDPEKWAPVFRKDHAQSRT